MKFNKSMLSNILFFGFLIFLFTPYGLSTRAKLTQGVTYVKTLLMPPKAEAVNERIEFNTDFSLKGITNATDVNLSELKGEVVFINYWATWCPPCRAEMPSLQSLYDDYKGKVSFVFITSDEKSKVDAFYTKHNYELPTYNILSNPPKEIDTKTLPATFVIDKKGKVALSEFGPANWNSNTVRELLDNLISE